MGNSSRNLHGSSSYGNNRGGYGQFRDDSDGNFGGSGGGNFYQNTQSNQQQDYYNNTQNFYQGTTSGQNYYSQEGSSQNHYLGGGNTNHDQQQTAPQFNTYKEGQSAPPQFTYGGQAAPPGAPQINLNPQSNCSSDATPSRDDMGNYSSARNFNRSSAGVVASGGDPAAAAPFSPFGGGKVGGPTQQNQGHSPFDPFDIPEDGGKRGLRENRV